MAAVADVGAAFQAKPSPEAAVDAPGAALLVAGPAVRVEPGLIITPPQGRNGGAVPMPSGSMGSWQMGHSGTT